MAFTRNLLSSVGAVALISYSSASLAQTIPSAADPVKAQKSFQPAPAPKADPSLLNQSAPKQASNKASQQRFTLGGVVIQGSTIYPAGTFDSLFTDKIGKTTSVAEIQQLAARITARYIADGYILAGAYVPKQNVGKDGKITIRVEEGRVGQVLFEGDQPKETAQNLVRTYAAKIKGASPLKTDSLERYLLLINDLAGNSARAVLRPSQMEPGSTDLVLLYNHKPYDITLNTDNRGSRFIGSWQNSAGLALNNQLGADERIALRGVVTSPTKEMRFFDAQYEQPIGSEGTKLTLSGSIAKTEPGDSIKALDVRSKSINAAAKVTHPVIRSRIENLNARGIFDLRNSETDLFVTNKQSADRVRSLRAGVAYDIADSMNGVNLVDAEVSQGISLGATNDGFGRTRIRGEHTYTKLNLDLSRTQGLPYGFSAAVSGTSQYSFDPLLSSEQFTLGGPAFGNAYDPGELSGDHGIAGKVELRYGQTLGDPFVNSYQLYTYYDVGSVWRLKHLASEKNQESLASFGFGTRVNFSQNISGNLEFAYPLTKNYAADATNNVHILAGLSARY